MPVKTESLPGLRGPVQDERRIFQACERHSYAISIPLPFLYQNDGPHARSGRTRTTRETHIPGLRQPMLAHGWSLVTHSKRAVQTPDLASGRTRSGMVGPCEVRKGYLRDEKHKIQDWVGLCQVWRDPGIRGPYQGPYKT